MSVPVDVSGKLSVTAESGAQFFLEAEGDEIAINLANLWIGRSLAKQSPGRKNRQAMIRKVHAALRHSDLSLRVQIAGQSVAYLSPESKESVLSKLFGLGAMELKPRAFLIAIVRSM